MLCVNSILDIVGGIGKTLPTLMLAELGIARKAEHADIVESMKHEKSRFSKSSNPRL